MTRAWAAVFALGGLGLGCNESAFIEARISLTYNQQPLACDLGQIANTLVDSRNAADAIEDHVIADCEGIVTSDVLPPGDYDVTLRLIRFDGTVAASRELCTHLPRGGVADLGEQVFEVPLP